MISNIIINAVSPSGTAGEPMPNYAGSASLSAYNNLVKSAYFSSVAKMYDQVRLDWVKVKITPTQSVLLQGQKLAIFASAWDRNGLTNKDKPPGFAEICSYSSAFQRAINLDASSWNATRKIYASSIAEKSFWIPTSYIQEIANLSDPKAMDTGFNIPPGQSLAVPWNPQLLLGVLVSATTYNNGVIQTLPVQNQVWNFFIEFEWGLSFKGLLFDVPDDNLAIPSASVVRNAASQPLMGVMDIDGSDNIQPLPSTDRKIDFTAGANTLYINSYWLEKTGKSSEQMTLPVQFRRAYPKPGQFYFKSKSATGQASCAAWLILSFGEGLDMATVSLRIAYVMPGDSTFFEPSELEKLIYISEFGSSLFGTDNLTNTFVVNYSVGYGNIQKLTLTSETGKSLVSPIHMFTSVQTVLNSRSFLSTSDWQHRLIPFTQNISKKNYVGEVYSYVIDIDHPDN